MSYKKNSKQPDILFLISEFNFLKSHRLNLIRFLSKKYKRILILTNIEEVDPAELKRLNLSSKVKFKNFYLDRSAIGIFKNLLFLFNLFKVLVFYKPKRLFLVSSKPILLGGICSLFLPIQKTYFNISGLGYLFISEKFKAKIIKNLVLIIYRIIFMNRNSKVVFQNKEDLNYFVKKKIVKSFKAELLRGNGVDTNFFTRKRRPEKLTFLFASRLLLDKGITEYLDAARSLSDPNIIFKVAGKHDENNPNCLGSKELNDLKKNPFVEYLGIIEYEKMPELFNASDVFVLPSYREGLPKVALEAACTEMPLILTDVNGCRDCLIEGKTGFFARPRDSEDLKEKMFYFIHNKDQIRPMGIRSREFIEANFSEKIMFPKYDLLFKK